MGWLFAALARRVRAMLLADVAGWLEARFRARAADRRTWLYVEADRHEAAGRKDVATELRQQAGELTADRPLAAGGRPWPTWRTTGLENRAAVRRRLLGRGRCPPGGRSPGPGEAVDHPNGPSTE